MYIIFIYIDLLATDGQCVSHSSYPRSISNQGSNVGIASYKQESSNTRTILKLSNYYSHKTEKPGMLLDVSLTQHAHPHALAQSLPVWWRARSGSVVKYPAPILLWLSRSPPHSAAQAPPRLQYSFLPPAPPVSRTGTITHKLIRI